MPGPRYNAAGNTKLRVTLFITISVSGKSALVRVVFGGKRNLAEIRLADMPSDGITGQWRFSVQDNAWMTMDIFLEVVKDLNNHVVKNNIKKPVLLFLDGFRGYLSLAISEFCRENQIQLILFLGNECQTRIMHILSEVSSLLSLLSQSVSTHCL